MAATQTKMRELFDLLVKALENGLTALSRGEKINDKPSSLLRVGVAFLADQKITLQHDKLLATDRRWEDCRALWTKVLQALLAEFDEAKARPIKPHALGAAAKFLEANGVSREAADRWKAERELRRLDAEDFPTFLD